MLFDTAQNVRNHEMSPCAWSAIFNALSHVEQREHSYPGRGIHDSIVTVPVSAQVPNGNVTSAKALRLKEEGKERHSFQCNLVNLVDLWLVATAERAIVCHVSQVGTRATSDFTTSRVDTLRNNSAHLAAHPQSRHHTIEFSSMQPCELHSLKTMIIARKLIAHCLIQSH